MQVVGRKGHSAHQKHPPQVLTTGDKTALGISLLRDKDSTPWRESRQVTSSFLSWSFGLGRYFGIEVRIHWTFVLFIVMRLLQSQDFKFAALYLGILFLSVLVHEYGHCFMARRFRLRADQILLWPFGGLAFVAPGRNAREDFWIAFGGPLTHLPTAALALGGLLYQGAVPHLQMDLLDPVGFSQLPPGWPGLVLLLVFKVQLLLFGFNVFLPAYPMDGGRILVSLLLPRLGAMKTSGILVATTALSGIYLLTSSESIIAFFLIFTAYELWHMRKIGAIYSHPSFCHTTSYGYTSTPKARPKSKAARQVPYLRVVGRTCPKCKREVPDKARMCGFCEIEI